MTRITLRIIGLVAILSVLGLIGCEKARFPGSRSATYAECLSERLKSVHTKEGSAAIIAACSQESPPGADLRKVQRVVQSVNIQGTAGVDENFVGIGNRFSGTLHNPSRDVVVTEVVVRLSIKKAEVEKPAPAPPWQPPLNYAVQVEIWPQSAVEFSIPIVPFKDYGRDWGVTTVYGVDTAVALGAR